MSRRSTWVRKARLVSFRNDDRTRARYRVRTARTGLHGGPTDNKVVIKGEVGDPGERPEPPPATGPTELARLAALAEASPGKAGLSQSNGEIEAKTNSQRLHSRYCALLGEVCGFEGAASNHLSCRRRLRAAAGHSRGLHGRERAAWRLTSCFRGPPTNRCAVTDLSMYVKRSDTNSEGRMFEAGPAAKHPSATQALDERYDHQDPETGRSPGFFRRFLPVAGDGTGERSRPQHRLSPRRDRSLLADGLHGPGDPGQRRGQADPHGLVNYVV